MMLYLLAMFTTFCLLMWIYTVVRELQTEHGYVKVAASCFLMALLWPVTLIVWLSVCVFEVID